MSLSPSLDRDEQVATHGAAGRLTRRAQFATLLVRIPDTTIDPIVN